MKHRLMNKMLKRILFLILVLSLISTAGCGVDTNIMDGQEGTQTDENGVDKDQTNEGDPAQIGLINFQTQDIYGNDVNQSIFQDYSLTLVNVWGTFCGPCLDEMPDLGELQKEYEPKGVNIVGIVVDVQGEDMEILADQLELAKQIASGTEADYTHMLITEEMIEAVLNQFDAIPASFFVDSDGNIVSEFYIGSRKKEDWVTIIETAIENQ